MTTTTKSTTDSANDSAASKISTDDLTQRAREAASSVSKTAEAVTSRIPDAASEVDRVVRSSSDDTLRLATVAIVGFSAGLLLGGANRLLVLTALAPAAFVGLVLSGRRSV